MTHNENPIADLKQREQALDPTRSFIVQAPAGAGKTELLIQRYLTLLGTVAAPEEIIAITFTRKAAAEMRLRVMKALERAKNPVSPGTPHAKKTWELSKNALARDARFGWRILENPLRLKIQTIDSLCAGLTRQMPYLSRFGAQPEITDQPDALYKEAARNTVAELETGARWSPAIEALVRHLDNHLSKIEELVAAMLAKRDQWLRHTEKAADEKQQRDMLEQALVRVTHDALENVRKTFPGPGRDILLASLQFAVENLKNQGKSSAVFACEGLTDLPGAEVEDLDRWLGLADFLLTAKGEWRKTVTVKNGFPAPSSAKNNSILKEKLQAAKDAFMGYLEMLSPEDDAAEALARVRILPAPAYTDDQWRIMQALFEILKVAVGHLKLVFQREGNVDFAEIGIRADAALGKPDDPTDLSLSMDYRISHILMDEFQDTSFTQYGLVECLTGGWTPGDGRTFFAVGDPMQSIYGFREAEVGLFLNAWKNGIGQVPLTPLTLSVNFRSQQKIIDWVNDCFSTVMPRKVDITLGRVAYSPSAAFHPGLDGDAVRVHPFLPADREKEARRVAACVKKTRKKDPDGTVAVLVRSRSHLTHIVAALKSEGIRFQALEIDSLQNRPVITDLIALSRALAHPADRIAWLAVLRAPWCGLTLNDLHALAGSDPHRPILELMQSEEKLSRVSADGRKRLQRVCEILLPAVVNRNRKSFRCLVEGVWIALGGPVCVFDPLELDDADVFFDLLEQQANDDVISDIPALEAAAAALFAGPSSDADDCVQIMTIHKAKGLEFDTVILPGLERQPPADAFQLLLWLERAAGNDKDLLLAPISETGSDTSGIYQYIRKVHEEKRGFEDTRLLYVAATRARKYLHLMAGVTISAKDREVRKPPEKTLLKALWPAVGEVFYRMNTAMQKTANAPEIQANEDAEMPETKAVPYIRRLTPGWMLPHAPADVAWAAEDTLAADNAETVETPEFDWAGEIARIIGVVAHAWLRVIAANDADLWDSDRIQALEKMIIDDLFRSGVRPEEINGAAKQVLEVLANAVTHEKGRWILAGHPHSACEYALTGVVDGRVVSVKIDRTFVDEHNVRWIIDYKTGTHKGGALEEFLDREKLRYQDQMETYKQLMAAKEDREIRVGLYFPGVCGWREW